MSALSLARAMEAQGLADGNARRAANARLPGETFDAYCERLGWLQVDWAHIERGMRLPEVMRGKGK